MLEYTFMKIIVIKTTPGIYQCLSKLRLFGKSNTLVKDSNKVNIILSFNEVIVKSKQTAKFEKKLAYNKYT